MQKLLICYALSLKVSFLKINFKMTLFNILKNGHRKFSSAKSPRQSWNNKHPLFKHRSVCENVWQIVEKFYDSWNLANIYFFRGSHADLLCDTGTGVYPLNSFLDSSGLRQDPKKPLLVVLTHTHFDHSGGAYQFSKVFTYA